MTISTARAHLVSFALVMLAEAARQNMNQGAAQSAILDALRAEIARIATNPRAVALRVLPGVSAADIAAATDAEILAELGNALAAPALQQATATPGAPKLAPAPRYVRQTWAAKGGAPTAAARKAAEERAARWNAALTAARGA